MFSILRFFNLFKILEAIICQIFCVLLTLTCSIQSLIESQFQHRKAALSKRETIYSRSYATIRFWNLSFYYYKVSKNEILAVRFRWLNAINNWTYLNYMSCTIRRYWNLDKYKINICIKYNYRPRQITYLNKHILA